MIASSVWRKVLRGEHLTACKIACESVDIVVLGDYFLAIAESTPLEAACEVANARVLADSISRDLTPKLSLLVFVIVPFGPGTDHSMV